MQLRLTENGKQYYDKSELEKLIREVKLDAKFIHELQKFLESQELYVRERTLQSA